MITVTLTFTSIDAAVRALREIPESALAGAPVAAPVVKDEAPDPKPTKASKASKPAAEPVAAQPQTTAGREEAPVPAAAAAQPEPAPAPTVEYATLQKAVFALAAKSREAAAAIAQSFGVKTFKELPAELWGAAYAAVTAKLAEIEGA